MAVISTHVDGNVMVVVSNNPPVNALSAAVREGIRDALVAAAVDPNIDAVVIRADGRTFFAGADITEFGKPPRAPQLPGLIDTIEASAKPVVAAIHGTALGGGLELAMGCHYRVAVPSARLGLPEVKLGLLPGAGGTQRLPRLVGVPAALSMITSGNPVGAAEASELGLLDAVVDEEQLESGAVAFAREMARKSCHPVTRGLTEKLSKTDGGVFAAFREVNARKFRGLNAPEMCIRAVEAAVSLPYEQGIAEETAMFRELVGGVESRALRHVFFAERAASKIADIPSGIQTTPVKSVGVLGAGTMGGGIAMNFLAAGIPVTIVEREQSALDRGMKAIGANYDRSVAKGRMGEDDAAMAMGLLSGSLEYESLADCDLIIEAVFELMDIKQDVFRRLDKVAKPTAILASNTSYLDLDEIAAVTRRPGQVIGLHFFSPANIMKLLEIVRGAKTEAGVLATCMHLARKIGKVPVVSGVGFGFIGNRMLRVRQNEALAMLLEGAKPAEVDRVMVEFGFPMGPFQMADLAGLDIGWDPRNTSGSTIKEVFCERGRLGQKAGKGFYDYDEKRKRSQSTEANELIADFAFRAGKAQREFSDGEILERLLYPMINEAAQILEEGIAQRASDIDTVWINGYGWPPATGGPMFWAESVGLQTIVNALEKLKLTLPDLVISDFLRRKAASAGFFDD